MLLLYTQGRGFMRSRRVYYRGPFPSDIEATSVFEPQPFLVLERCSSVAAEGVSVSWTSTGIRRCSAETVTVSK